VLQSDIAAGGLVRTYIIILVPDLVLLLILTGYNRKSKKTHKRNYAFQKKSLRTDLRTKETMYINIR
jgi:hypothetical protein